MYSVLTSDYQWIEVSGSELRKAKDRMGLELFRRRIIAVVRNGKKK